MSVLTIICSLNRLLLEILFEGASGSEFISYSFLEVKNYKNIISVPSLSPIKVTEQIKILEFRGSTVFKTYCFDSKS